MNSDGEKTRASNRQPQGEKNAPGRASRFQDVGRRIDEAAQETERLIAYLNNEVVPAVRQHSSRGLRKAAQKLAEFADYLESKRGH